MSHFKGKRFKQDIIMVAVGYYLRYNLSYRDVSEILNERGIKVVTQLFIDGYKNMVRLFIAYGRKEISLLAILGEWMKHILK